MTQRSALAAKAANGIQGCISRSSNSRFREWPFLSVRHWLDRIWELHPVQGFPIKERDWHTGIFKSRENHQDGWGQGNTTHMKRHQEVGVFSLENRRLRGYLTASLQVPVQRIQREQRLSSDVHSNKLTGNENIFEDGKSWLNIMRKLFLPLGWSNMGWECPERLQNLHPWRCSRLRWTSPKHPGLTRPIVTSGLDKMSSRGPTQTLLYNSTRTMELNKTEGKKKKKKQPTTEIIHATYQSYGFSCRFVVCFLSFSSKSVSLH